MYQGNRSPLNSRYVAELLHFRSAKALNGAIRLHDQAIIYQVNLDPSPLQSEHLERAREL